MQITKEFLETEIADLENERRKAHEFCIRATAAIEVHKMLIARMEAPEPEIPVDANVTPIKDILKLY